MTTLTISMPESLREFVENEVKAAGFGNVSEYIRDLIRREQKRLAKERLESLLLEGLASGEPLDVTPEFWSELRRDAATILARKKQPGKAQSENEDHGTASRTKRSSAAD